MKNVIIETKSGVLALVAASTISRAETAWEELVSRGDAEPMVLARRPAPGEVREIAKEGIHDYR